MPLLDDALTRLDRADDAGAAAVLERLAAETPTHATVHVLRAQTCERLHRWDDALAAWQTARLFLPDLGLVHEGTLRAARVLAAIQTLRTPPRHAEPAPSAVAPLPVDRPPGADAPVDVPPASSPVVASPAVHATAVPAVEIPPAPGRAAEPASVFFDPFSTTPRARPWEPSPGADPTAVPEPSAPVEPDPDVWAWHDVPESSTSDAAAPEGWADVSMPEVPADPAPFETSAARVAEPEPVPDADARLPGIPSTFDLDDLIESLSSAGRIVPRDDVDAVPPPPGLDADAADEVVSPTLARIFAAQGQTAEAIRAFERLAETDPARAAEFRAEADALRARTR